MLHLRFETTPADCQACGLSLVYDFRKDPGVHQRGVSCCPSKPLEHWVCAYGANPGGHDLGNISQQFHFLL